MDITELLYGLAVLICLSDLAVAYFLHAKASAFALLNTHHGVTANGKVLGKSETGQQGSRSHWLNIGFADEKGNQRQEIFGVSFPEWSAAKPGDSADVLYLRSDPKVRCLKAQFAAALRMRRLPPVIIATSAPVTLLVAYLIDVYVLNA